MIAELANLAAGAISYEIHAPNKSIHYTVGLVYYHGIAMMRPPVTQYPTRKRVVVPHRTACSPLNCTPRTLRWQHRMCETWWK